MEKVIEKVKIQIIATNEDPNKIDAGSGPSLVLLNVEIPKDKYKEEHFAEVVSMSLQMWHIASALRCMVVRKDNLNRVVYVR